MKEFQNLKEIVAKVLVGKTLLYINSHPYENTIITDIVNISSYYQDHDSAYTRITIGIKSKVKYKGGFRDRTKEVSFLDDDIITIA